MSDLWKVRKIANMVTPTWVVHEPDGSWSRSFPTWREAYDWASNVGGTEERRKPVVSDLWLDDVCEHFVGLDMWGPNPDPWRECLVCGYTKQTHDLLRGNEFRSST